MTLLRRLSLVVAIVFCASLSFAAAANAAWGSKGSGPGPLAPGDYVTTVTRADAVFGQQGPPGPPIPKGGPGPSTDPQVSIFAVNDFESFQPEENHDQAPTSTNTTTVFVQLFNTPASGGGCFLIQPPSVLTISKDLQSAHLKATFDSTTPTCPGFPPGLLLLPITVNLTWTGLGVVSKGHDHNTLQCAGYTTEATTNSRDGGGAASGTVAVHNQPDIVLDRTVAGLHLLDTHMSANGVQKPACVINV